MSCCACCCFYPKYKRKVDNIYPRQIDDPLIKNEVDKLQYYVTTHPEKLSKIGEYLYQYLKYGLHSYKNRNYVKNTVEAVEKVLVATAPQNLNYYAPNCLKIIQKLLEQGGVGGRMSGASDTLMTRAHSSGVSNSNSSSGIHSSSGPGTDNLEYQKMAASLFQKFCEKEASNLASVTYNLNFDTFVCQFSSMCYNSNKDTSVRAEIRCSALQCLATMAKRLVPDDNLKASYMWDNMDKIVPAVLFIMHENYVVKDREGRNILPINIDDNLKIDEKELDRYLYGDFYINSKSSHNIYGSDEAGQNNLNEEDAIRIEFRKAARGSSSHLHSNSSSGTSTPDEGKVMISLNKNKVLTNQPTGVSNGQQQTNSGSSSLPSSVDPDHEAKMLLKTLASKADFTTLAKIVVPILTFLDDNKPNGWECAKIVRCIFLILMYNIKQQHAIVIKELLKHLDSHRNSPAQLKCYIIRTIVLNTKIAAMQSIGTTGQIIEIYTNLLKQLNLSVEKSYGLKTQLLNKKLGPSATPAPNNNPIIASGSNMKKSSSTTSANETTSRAQNELTEEHKLQSEIISAMGQFVSNLPDYAKNDVVMFIARQINSPQFHYVDVVQRQNEQLNTREQVQLQQRAKYFECLYEICCKYNPVDQCFAAFNTSSQFLEDILRLTLVGDWSSRRKAHEILQQLLDRYHLLDKIKQLKPSLFTNYFIGSGIVVVKNDPSFSREYRSSNQSLNYRQSIDASSALESASQQSLRQQNQQSSPSTSKPGKSNNNRHSSSALITRNQTYLSQLELNENRLATSREDTLFMRKYGRLFLAYLNENLFLANNRRENFESIYLTTCLFIIGIFGEKEFLVDLIRFGFHVQELALLNYDQPQFTHQMQCNVHKFVCAYFLLLSKSSGIKEFYDYCSDICDLRRTRDLFKFVYPEYILLDNVDSSSGNLPGGGGLATLSEIENEFKKELSNSAKEYANVVKKIQQQSILLEQNELSDSKQNLALTDSSNKLDNGSRLLSSSQRSLASLSASNTNLSISGGAKVAQWLFSKQVVGDILKNAGLPTSLLFQQTSDYSLSVSYLKQTLLSLQTVIKFRSPYSNSFESLVSLTQADIQQLQSKSGHLPSTSSALSTGGTGGQLGSTGAYNHSNMTNSASGSNFGGAGTQPISQHKRVTSNLSSHFATTPRRSIDVESTFDGDETSYDSTSQISVDPNELDFLTQQNMKLFANSDLDGVVLPNQQSQTSMSSFNALKQQYYQQQQQYNDFTSFDTIKKVLFNGTMTGSGMGSNYSNSGAGPAGGSTMLSPASILVTSNPAAVLLNTPAQGGSQHQNSLTQRSSQLHQFTLNNNNSMSMDNETMSQSSDMQADNNARIINEFKQKPFDELKKTLQKSNQMYVNSEKYQHMLELISKELGVGYQTGPSSNSAQAVSNQGGVGINSDAVDSTNNMINGPVASKNMSYSSLSTTSNQSSALNSNNLLLKDNYQQKITPLNDIEFPELFMYG